MRWFRRRRRATEDEPAPGAASHGPPYEQVPAEQIPAEQMPADPFDGVADEELEFLSVAQARRVRGLVRAAFGERGLEVTVHGGHVEDSGGRIFGLHNVAAACHNDERGPLVWPEVVDAHVRRVLADMDAPDPVDVLPLEELLGLVLVRLYESDGVPGLDAFPHLDFAPGVVQMLALDQPETVHVLSGDRIDRIGGWPRLYERGLANLRREATGPSEQIDAGAGATFHLLLDDSVYTASRALLLPELLAGQAVEGLGWLLSMPNRHQLVWHVIRDETVLPALRAMAVFTDLGFRDAVGPLSPHVYWWSGMEYRQITSTGADGQIEVHIQPDFQQVLQRLLGPDGG